MLTIKNLSIESEHFPALLLHSNNNQNRKWTLDDLANFYLEG
jgi:hypothetical protein